MSTWERGGKGNTASAASKLAVQEAWERANSLESPVVPEVMPQ